MSWSDRSPTHDTENPCVGECPVISHKCQHVHSPHRTPHLSYSAGWENSFAHQNILSLAFLLEANKYCKAKLHARHHFEEAVDFCGCYSLVSDHPWCMTKWSLTGGGRLRERSIK